MGEKHVFLWIMMSQKIASYFFEWILFQMNGQKEHTFFDKTVLSYTDSKYSCMNYEKKNTLEKTTWPKKLHTYRNICAILSPVTRLIYILYLQFFKVLWFD